MTEFNLHALVLAGGSGTRFWPLSRRDRPKQLLRVGGDETLLQATVSRIAPLAPADRVWVCTHQRLARDVVRQVPTLTPSQVLAEPAARNTAAALGFSARAMLRSVDEDDVVVSLHSDHWIERPSVFVEAIDMAARAVSEEDAVYTIGIAPRWAETGYGYLEVEDELDGEMRPMPVRRFVEKPDAETAKGFVEGRRHLWNAGIFVFKPRTLLGHLEAFEPELYAGLEQLRIDGESRLDEAGAAIYEQLPKISIDEAVMERLENIGVVPVECGWNDVGSFDALTQILAADDDGNHSSGDVLALDARDNLLWSETGQIAAIGVEGLIVVQTGDTVLVLPRGRAQDVKHIVERLQSQGRTELL